MAFVGIATGPPLIIQPLLLLGLYTCKLQTKHTIFQRSVAGISKAGQELYFLETNNTPWPHISACYIHLHKKTHVSIHCTQKEVHVELTGVERASQIITEVTFVTVFVAGLSIGAGELDYTEAGTIGAMGATWIQTFHSILLLRYYTHLSPSTSLNSV